MFSTLTGCLSCHYTTLWNTAKSKSMTSEDPSLYWDLSVTDQLEEVFPEVLSHQSEQRQERPTKRVVAGVAVVWVSACLQTDITLWTDPEHIIITIIFITIIIIIITNTIFIIIFITIIYIFITSSFSSSSLSPSSLLLWFITSLIG